MSASAHRNPLTSQVTLTVLALAIFALTMVVGFGYYAMQEADRVSLERQKILVANGLKDAIEAQEREQESVSVWDDSVVKAKAGDQDWMAQNLSVWMYSYYGIDRVYVLDDHNQPIHAMREGKLIEPSLYAEDQPMLQAMIDRLRSMIADPPEDGLSKLVVEDLISLDGKPAILTIKPLVPDTERVTQEPGTEYLHVSTRFIGGGIVEKIAEQYLLSDARILSLSQKANAAAVPLVDSRGVILGYLGWNQYRPGMTLVRSVIPAFLAMIFLAVATMGYLLRGLRRASTALQNSQDEARYLAFHDTLTGLPNRVLFEDRLQLALAYARRAGAKVGLLYLDLDRFKHVNDTLGHPAGDELVRQVANRLQRAIREIDTVARLGGDEFAIILTNIANARIAEEVCERLLQKMQEPFTLMGDQVFIGASIGIALATQADADAEDLLRKADIALYEAKKRGRGRYQAFAGDMDDILLRKRRIESELRAALAGGKGIRLVYQPIFAADGRTVLGAEALMRWNHDVHGALPTQQFIAIAEERGLIVELGEWALREACRFASGSNLPWISVNVSPLQLRDSAFAEKVAGILGQNGLAPEKLQMEITESVLLDSNETVGHVLAALRAAGIRIALDDFGTGYSSLSYLRRHSIDKLKIDRSFIRLLESDDASTAIVKALIDLATALDVEVTAEGVETDTQKSRLVAMGCSQFQGYLFAPPLEPAQLLSLGHDIVADGSTTEAARA